MIPEGLDHSAWQIADWQLGLVQNISTTRIWRTKTMIDGSEVKRKGVLSLSNKLDTTHDAPIFILETFNIDGSQSFVMSRPAVSNSADPPYMQADDTHENNEAGPNYLWSRSELNDSFTIWVGLVEVHNSQIQSDKGFIPLKQNSWQLNADSNQENQAATPSSGDGSDPSILPSLVRPTAGEAGGHDTDFTWENDEDD